MIQNPPKPLPRGVSVVVPVFNGAPTVVELVERLVAILTTRAGDFQIILVNDGSADDSWFKICELARRFPRVEGLSLMRNYGQHNALLCGVRAAQFDVIVTMDDDLQHPPEEVPKLLAALGNDYDVVYGCPEEMPHSPIRNLASRATKAIASRLIRSRQLRFISAFRAFRTQIRHAFDGFQGPQLSFDLLLSWGTNRMGCVPVVHNPRQIGKSNYGLLKLIDHTLILLTSYSTVPLRLASLLGLGVTTAGIGIMFYVIIRYFIAGSVPGFPFLASIITVFGGAQLLTLGVIGEYLARVYNRALDRPTYVVLAASSDSDGKSFWSGSGSFER